MTTAIRSDFPLLSAHPELAYLDSAATAQKPACVLEALERFYKEENALRGVYDLSQRATQAYEDAREKAADFIGAKSAEEIIFTRNATEGLNLISYAWADAFLKEGDEVLISVMEHHSNLLPWQRTCRRTGAKLVYVDCGADGTIPEEAFRAALSERTRLVCMTQLSNVLGTRNEIARFAALAHEKGALFVCDGAQSVPHLPVDVQALDVDFLAFSGHKMCAPMGIGVLYVRKKVLKKMPPFLYGGEMIDYVGRYEATFAELPHRFEAGTVNAAGAVGLGAAIDYYTALGWETILRREEELGLRLGRTLRSLPFVHILGSADDAAHHGIYSFTVDGVHPHDVAAILDADGVAVRAGHHCAQPLLQHLGVLSTTRASLMFYNTEEEIDRLGRSLKTVRSRMGYEE